MTERLAQRLTERAFLRLPVMRLLIHLTVRPVPLTRNPPGGGGGRNFTIAEAAVGEEAGLLESSLYVDELETARDWYVRVLGLQVIVEDARFAALGVTERQILLLFVRSEMGVASDTPWGVIPAHRGAGALHVAFAIDPGSVGEWERTLGERSVTVESRIEWPRGGTSLYVRDPDGHLVELATPGLWPGY